MSSSTANAKVAMPETEAVNHLDCFNSQVSVATEDGNNNIDVELRMAEFPEDDPNLNPTPNTLEGRIARQQQKIEEIEGEITATQRELKRVKEKAFKYLGEEFIEE